MDEGSGMNVKAMARAKRAASQRGRSRASHAKQRTDVGKGTAAAAAEKREEEEASDTEPDIVTIIGHEERVMPKESAELDLAGEGIKSKGWDYAELLSQRTMPLYHDVPGLCIGVNDMSSISLAKGLDSLGWNFEDLYGIQATDSKVDDVSYLSLDLRTLGENLAQLGIAQRLFLDEEILQMGLSSSEKQILNCLDKKVVPTEVIHGTSMEDRKAGMLNISSIVPDMFSEGSTVNVTEQVGSIQNDCFGEVDAYFSTGCEQAALSFPSSAEHPQIKPIFENNTALKSNRPIEVLPTNTFAATAAEAELDALLDGAEKQNSSIPFDGNTGSVLASGSWESLISSSSRALLSPFTQDPNKSTANALADADVPPVQISSSPEYMIPSSSQTFPSPLKQDPDKSNTKVAADAAIPLQSITPGVAPTLSTLSNAKSTEGEVGSALLGSSEDDFDAWLDSI